MLSAFRSVTALILLVPTAGAQLSAGAAFPVSKSAGVGAAAQPRLAVGSSGSWTTYHHDNAHTGYDPVAPALGSIGPTSGWTESTLDGEVYAEPLIYKGLVYAATLNNTVYGIDQATGLVTWSNHLGTPQGSGWICGNVAPMGILGTPVIDAAGNRIFAVAEIAGATPTYRLFGLDLANGNILFNAPIAPTGLTGRFNSKEGRWPWPTATCTFRSGGVPGTVSMAALPTTAGWSEYLPAVVRRSFTAHRLAPRVFGQRAEW